MLIIEVNTFQLMIIAALSIIILLALMIARHFEEKRDKYMIDKIDDDIKID